MGIVYADTEAIEQLKREKEECESSYSKLVEILEQFSKLPGYDDEDSEPEELRVIRQQAALLKGHIDFVTHKIDKLEKEIRVEYPGRFSARESFTKALKYISGTRCSTLNWIT